MESFSASSQDRAHGSILVEMDHFLNYYGHNFSFFLMRRYSTGLRFTVFS